MTLYYRGVVKREYIRSTTDRRVRVLCVTADYRGEDSETYRKSFERRQSGGEPIVPVYGTHEQLDAARLQWTPQGYDAAQRLTGPFCAK